MTNAKVLHDHIVARICRLADAMIRMSSRELKERWNLRNTDLRILNILEGNTPLSLNAISRNAFLDQAWVSRSIRALEAAKLVQRCAHPTDSRITLARLTKRGRQIIDESRPYAAWSERVLLAQIDARELKALLDQLETNTQNLINRIDSRTRTPVCPEV